MQPVRRAAPLLEKGEAKRRDSALDRRENLFFLVLRRTAQHVIDHLRFVAGMSDTDAQAPVIRAHVRGGVAQAIVAAGTAAELET